MFKPNVKITIDNINISAVNEVSIKRSIYELAATATIKVPVSAVLKYKGEPPTRIETAQEIKVGQKVEIQLGYNGQYNVEFRGYVKSLNRKNPLEIICEDEFWNTRTKHVTIEGKTTVKEILEKCGLNTAYAAELSIPDFPIDNKPVSLVLSKLKSDYKLSVFFDMNGSVYASEPYKIVCESGNYSPKNNQTGGTSEQPSGVVESPVKYRLRENVIKDDDLKYQKQDGVKYKIKAACTFPDGTYAEATAGPADGIEKTITFYDVENEDTLKSLADNELRKYNNEIYDGKIETFLQPFAIPCMVAAIEDPKYSERNGNYYIESVDVKLGMGGGRRTIEIGIKL